jgi:membrane associated rhomboid family serine protease
MGFYDRDYYREEQEQPPGLVLRAPRTVVTVLVIVNVALWLADFFTNYWLGNAMAVHTAGCHGWPETLTTPWAWWQLITYGFAHSRDFFHVLNNMIGLWFLGRDIEFHYGRREFVRLYLALLLVGGLAWALVNHLQGQQNTMAIGASGAVAGIVVLYALNFPHRTVLFFFVLPMPAWVLGVLLVCMDVFGVTGARGDNVAYTIHLAGAAFALVYVKLRWNFTRWTSFRLGLPGLRREPKLRVHDPEQQWRELKQEMDRILEKYGREGESSLTRKERRTLEEASRELRRRRGE